jgi:hypothetical protein
MMKRTAKLVFDSESLLGEFVKQSRDDGLTQGFFDEFSRTLSK